MKIQFSKNCTDVPVWRKMFLLLPAVVFISGSMSCKKETTTSKTESSNSVTSASIDETVSNNTNFGAQISIGSVDEKMAICDLLGVKYVRDGIILKKFNGKVAGIDKYMNNGFKVLLNLNYDFLVDSKGHKKPVPFPKDMVEYKRLLTKVLDKYKPEIAVIENEPVVDIFHSGPIEDYITELKTAIEVCKSRGIKVADGSVNVQMVQMLMRGNNGRALDANLVETKKLIEAYKKLDLDYVNVHTHAPFTEKDNPNAYPPGLLEDVANYLRAQTGKEVISNEVNQRNQSADLMTSIVKGFKAGNYKYVIVRSDDGTGKNESLHNGPKLSIIGRAYRDAIK